MRIGLAVILLVSLQVPGYDPTGILSQVGLAPAPRESRLFGSLERGPHAVGFRTVSLTRAGKTIHLAIWYPAAPSDAPPMLLSNYLEESPDLRGAVRGFPSTAESRKRTLAVAISGDAAGVPSQTLDDDQLASSRGATRVKWRRDSKCRSRGCDWSQD